MDWVGEAESKMRLLGITTSQQKASFVQSSGGIELSTFWEKEARIRWVASTDPVQDAHTYEEIIAESKSALLQRYILSNYSGAGGGWKKTCTFGVFWGRKPVPVHIFTQKWVNFIFLGKL